MKSPTPVRSPKIAIVGGGPGGLFSALMLNRYAPDADVTIFEASDRLGGKLKSRRFAQSGALYEAGAAELYDYSHVGEDPLRALVEALGLETQPLEGGTVFFQGRKIASADDLGRELGAETAKAVASNEYQSRVIAAGQVPVASASPEEFHAFIEREAASWAKVIKPLNLRLD